jgi:hypothetical protein
MIEIHRCFANPDKPDEFFSSFIKAEQLGRVSPEVVSGPADESDCECPSLVCEDEDGLAFDLKRSRVGGMLFCPGCHEGFIES